MHETKAQIRSRLRQQRRKLSAKVVADTSNRIFNFLCSFSPFQRAESVVLYSANENEVQTEAIWQEASKQGKAVYYPRISADRTTLEFVRRGVGQRLTPGTFGILIPPGNELLTTLQSTDVVLTPGVGFDAQGHRLGRGKGYYDRAFRGPLTGAIRIALTYAFQIFPSIPAGPEDEPVHYIISENGILDCGVKQARE